jgi:hypothetical protein
MNANNHVMTLVHEVANRFREIPGVVAITIGGSRSAASGDAESDIDLYIFSAGEVPPATRREIAVHYTTTPEIDNRYFGPEDAWRDEATGLKFDLIYWSPAWLEDQVDRVLMRGQASVGYSTCFWYTVLHALPLYDPIEWLAGLKARAGAPYPDALRDAIVSLNLPLLRQSQSSFLAQIELAQIRGDIVSVQHRVTAFLASYFDILFAINRLPHPGEKRLIAIARQTCHVLPENMVADVEDLIAGVSGTGAGNASSSAVVAAAHRLTDAIEALLASTA